MLEPEIACCDLDGLMEVEEQLLSHAVRRLLDEHRQSLAEVVGRDLAPLERVQPPFPRGI